MSKVYIWLCIGPTLMYEHSKLGGNATQEVEEERSEVLSTNLVEEPIQDNLSPAQQTLYPMWDLIANFIPFITFIFAWYDMHPHKNTILGVTGTLIALWIWIYYRAVYSPDFRIKSTQGFQILGMIQMFLLVAIFYIVTRYVEYNSPTQKVKLFEDSITVTKNQMMIFNICISLTLRFLLYFFYSYWFTEFVTGMNDNHKNYFLIRDTLLFLLLNGLLCAFDQTVSSWQEKVKLLYKSKTKLGAIAFNLFIILNKYYYYNSYQQALQTDLDLFAFEGLSSFAYVLLGITHQITFALYDTPEQRKQIKETPYMSILFFIFGLLIHYTIDMLFLTIINIWNWYFEGIEQESKEEIAILTGSNNLSDDQDIIRFDTSE